MPNIEELIKKAMREGKFDNLPGKGKKIHLEVSNPHADPEWELAYGMLKDAGYTLPWIETLQGIKKDIEAARDELRRAWQVHNLDCGPSSSEASSAADWERSQRSFRVKLEAINKRIRDYNLQVPAARFQRTLLNIEQEFNKITNENL